MDAGLTVKPLAWAFMLKRWSDIALSLAGLILLAPLFIIIAVLIQIDSPGGSFFRQARIGRAGRKFQIIKFRTMHTGSAEQLAETLRSDPVLRLTFEQHQKLIADPRLTGLGRLLRKTSLDELPQLWNVLIGEMSLVGPRPFLPEQLPFYGPLYQDYIRFRPGLTGLWQVSGRNGLSFRERVQLDADYLRNWSLGLDIRILLRTIGVVLTGNGAY